MATNVFPDIQVTEGDQTFDYSKEGPKCRRTFILDNCDMIQPCSTLEQLIFNFATDSPTEFDLPARGSPHPTIAFPAPWNTTNSFCADVLSARAITSNQAKVTVDYQIMNGLTQEAPDDGSADANLALLIVSSSVQTIQTSVDVAGNALIVPYCSGGTGTGGGTNAYDISTSANINGIFNAVTIKATPTSLGHPFIPGQPNNRVTASIQVPTVLLRFQRRESKPRNNLYVGYVNSTTWDLSAPWPSIGVIDEQCALCTRIENTTLDEGQTYCVTYEFQVGQLALPPQPYTAGASTAAEYVPPAAPILATTGKYIGVNCMSPWQAIAWYVISGAGTSTATNPATGTNDYLSGGQIPPDANPFIFQIYNDCDFSSVLSLPGTQGS